MIKLKSVIKEVEMPDKDSRFSKVEVIAELPEGSVLLCTKDVLRIRNDFTTYIAFEEGYLYSLSGDVDSQGTILCTDKKGVMRYLPIDSFELVSTT